MILEGNQRGFGGDLAQHLMNGKENEHVTLHSVEGFIANDLNGAFAEIEAISQATQANKYLFSLSLNPPIGALVSVEVFEHAIAEVEKKLGLIGQPRAIVFHEKNGRRHAHCVWSRIDTSIMKAIKLSHYKRKLCYLSRELYLTHDWDMPAGFISREDRDPHNYSRQEHQQAKRLKHDVKAMKAMFKACWEQSDSLTSFVAALKQEGFLLAKGERRGFVAVDKNGKIWSLSRWCGVKPKALRERLGDEDLLPSLAKVRQQLSGVSLPTVETVKPDAGFALKRSELVTRQSIERSSLLKTQETRRIAELKTRRAKRPKGLHGLFARVTGQFDSYIKQCDKEAEFSKQRDRSEQQILIDVHLAERRALENDARQHGSAKDFRASLTATFTNDPNQHLEIKANDIPFTQQQLNSNPALILAYISKNKSQFTRSDVLRALVKKIDDPFVLQNITDQALQSPDVIKVETGKTIAFTTRDYQNAEGKLQSVINRMASNYEFGVSANNAIKAIQSQNAKMKREFGGKLSQEQEMAIHHVLNGEQLSCVVGLAGAGKSTLLETAVKAWRDQEITVHGAALAGKAADGLESASGIKSRTLASLETSWENGFEPIKKGDVLVVDEAGMIGTRQMARISDKLQIIGAKLVLVGDPDQLQPIEAGTPFKSIVEKHNTAELTEIYRQKSKWQKKASRQLSAGHISEAIAAYTKQKCVKHYDTHDQTIEALVEAYTMDVASNGSNTTRLAFTHRRKDVHALNQAIRASVMQLKREELRTDYTVAQQEALFQTDTGKRAFAKGDRLVFLRNDKELGVKNGMLGTVKAVSENKIAVAIDGDKDRTLTFNPRKYRSFDHGYAVTIHKSQGATVDQSYVLASRTMDRHLAYVAMTRHRDSLKLYVPKKNKPLWMDKGYQLSHSLDFKRQVAPRLE